MNDRLDTNTTDSDHVVIDLETLSTRIDCVVTAIGVARVRDGELEESRSWYLAWDDQIALGRRVDQDTVRFWLDQSPELARRVNSGKLATGTALLELADFLGSAKVWGNGAAFDLGVLRSLHEAFNLEVPWSHRNERCYRTVRQGRERIYDAAVLHDPEFDAVAEARNLIAWELV